MPKTKEIPKTKAKFKAETMPPIDLPEGIIKFDLSRPGEPVRARVYTINRIPTGEQQRWARWMQREHGVAVEWVPGG